MVIASSQSLAEPSDVLPIPGVPLAPKQAALRAEIIGRFLNLGDNMEDAASMQFWNEGVYSEFRPRNSWHDWLTQQVSIYMMRINRAERSERRLRDLQALRAIDCWHVDQTSAAALLGAELASDPKRVVGELWCTPAGCDWMIDRWEGLASTPAADWSEPQRELARQLCPAAPHHYLTPGYARMRIQNLAVTRDRLRASDEALQTLTQSDLGPAPSRQLAELRRYTRYLQRQLKWYVTQLRTEPPKREPNPRYYPTFVEPTPTEPNPPTPRHRPRPKPTRHDQTRFGAIRPPNEHDQSQFRAPRPPNQREQTQFPTRAHRRQRERTRFLPRLRPSPDAERTAPTPLLGNPARPPRRARPGPRPTPRDSRPRCAPSESPPLTPVAAGRPRAATSDAPPPRYTSHASPDARPCRLRVDRLNPAGLDCRLDRTTGDGQATRPRTRRSPGSTRRRSGGTGPVARGRRPAPPRRAAPAAAGGGS